VWREGREGMGTLKSHLRNESEKEEEKSIRVRERGSVEDIRGGGVNMI
jgi:hypothetical protein